MRTEAHAAGGVSPPWEAESAMESLRMRREEERKKRRRSGIGGGWGGSRGSWDLPASVLRDGMGKKSKRTMRMRKKQLVQVGWKRNE